MQVTCLLTTKDRSVFLPQEGVGDALGETSYTWNCDVWGHQHPKTPCVPVTVFLFTLTTTATSFYQNFCKCAPPRCPLPHRSACSPDKPHTIWIRNEQSGPGPGSLPADTQTCESRATTRCRSDRGPLACAPSSEPVAKLGGRAGGRWAFQTLGRVLGSPVSRCAWGGG